MDKLLTLGDAAGPPPRVPGHCARFYRTIRNIHPPPDGFGLSSVSFRPVLLRLVLLPLSVLFILNY